MSTEEAQLVRYYLMPGILRILRIPRIPRILRFLRFLIFLRIPENSDVIVYVYLIPMIQTMVIISFNYKILFTEVHRK